MPRDLYTLGQQIALSSQDKVEMQREMQQQDFQRLETEVRFIASKYGLEDCESFIHKLFATMELEQAQVMDRR